MLTMMLWEPMPTRDILDCTHCGSHIKPKTAFFIEASLIVNLYPNSLFSPGAQCVQCGMREYLQQQFNNAAQAMELIDSQSPTQMGDDPLLTSIRKIIRYELRQILKEEAADPHGPFSPAP